MVGAMHTAGPWVVVGEYVEAHDLDTPLSICTLADCGDATQGNGRLIAAAPDLFEYVESSAQNGCATAIALIAKLKGE